MMDNVLSLVDLALEEQESDGFLNFITSSSGASSQSVNCGSSQSIGC